MSSLLRRIQLRMQRQLTDIEDPNYRAPREHALRRDVGKPYRHVGYCGKPEDPAPYGHHFTKRRASPNPARDAGASLHVPHHLLTLPRGCGSKGTHTRAQRKLALR